MKSLVINSWRTRKLSWQWKDFAVIVIVFFLSPNHAVGQSNQPPTIALNNPRPNFTYNYPSVTRFEAQAFDPDGQIVRVDFYLNSELFGNVTESPFILWLTNYGSALHSVYARAIDDQEAFTDSSLVTFQIIQELGPDVSIASPTNSSVFSENAGVPMTAAVNIADDLCTSVAFFVDDQLAGTDSTYPYSMTLTNLSVGQHVLRAWATNSVNEQPSLPITITIMQVTLLDPSSVGDEQFAFDIQGLLPGFVTVVEATADFARWDPIATNIAGDTRMSFLDRDSGMFDRRFYRAVVRPAPK